jgi:hypothetical protein
VDPTAPLPHDKTSVNIHSKTNQKRLMLGWVLALRPVILATQDTEIRMLQVQTQPRKIVCETLSQKKIHKKKEKKDWWSGSRCRP